VVVQQLEQWMFDGTADDLTAPPYLAAEAAWREENPGRQPEFEPGFPESLRAFTPDTRDQRLGHFADGDDGVHRERFMRLADSIAASGSLRLKPPQVLRALVHLLWPQEFGPLPDELKDDVPLLLRGAKSGRKSEAES
jgi:hypothetical protein